MKPFVKKNKIQNSADRIKKDIVEWLLQGGMSFDPYKDAIGNEVLFAPSLRRTDLLVLSESFHALEIKGDLDRLDKLSLQIEDYKKAFDKVSVVVTKKHLAKVREIVPKSVGLILTADGHMTVIRNPQINRRLDKASLLVFCNRKILVDLLQRKATRLCIGELRHVAQKQIATTVIREQAYGRLWETYGRLFRRFLNDTAGYPIQIDEIRALSAEVSPIDPLESNDQTNSPKIESKYRSHP